MNFVLIMIIATAELLTLILNKDEKELKTIG
jgi:hypothetical protein